MIEFEFRNRCPGGELAYGLDQQSERQCLGASSWLEHARGLLSGSNREDLINQLERHFYKPENALP